MMVKDELNKLFKQYFEDVGYHIVTYNQLVKLIKEVYQEYHDKCVMLPYNKGESYILRKDVQGLSRGDMVAITFVMNDIFEVYSVKKDYYATIDIDKRKEYLMSFEEFDEWKEIISKL